MSFLPIFQDYEAIELLGSGGYGKVFRCTRKENPLSPSSPSSCSQPNMNTKINSTTTNNNNNPNSLPSYSEDSISSNWRPKTVAIKMIQYSREPGKDKHLSWQQVAEYFGGPLHVVVADAGNGGSGSGSGKAADLVAVGLEGLKEAAALQTTGAHPSLIRLESCFYSLTYKSLCLVEEFADGPMLGDIYSHNGALSEKAMTAVIVDMLHGLLHLHSCRILHRDIKPTNILTCTKTGLSKIADMGVSALRPQIGDYRKTYVGTAGFMAPEVSERSQIQRTMNVNNNNNNNNNNNGDAASPIKNNVAIPIPVSNINNNNNTQGSPSPNNPSSPVAQPNENFDQQQQQQQQQSSPILSHDNNNNNNNNNANMNTTEQPSPHQLHWGPMSARTANSLFYSGEGYNEAADLWSMGISLLEGAIGQIQARQYVAKITGYFSFDEEAAARRLISMGMSPQRNYDDAFHLSRKSMENKMLGIFKCSAEMTDLLLSMLDPIPSRRPSCLTFLTQHPFCVNAMRSFTSSNNHSNHSNLPTSATEVTLNYVRNFNNNAMREYRRELLNFISRVPGEKADKGNNNLINAKDLGIMPNALLLNINRSGATPEEIDAAKLRAKKQIENAFRAPRSSAWTVPSSNNIFFSATSSSGNNATNTSLTTAVSPSITSTSATTSSASILDVVCALDFAATSATNNNSSSIYFSIGQGQAASLFTPVLQARETFNRCNDAGTTTLPHVLLANDDISTSSDFQAASQRIQVWCGGNYVNNNNNNNNAFAKNISTGHIPFGQLFQNLLSPSLDYAMTRTARLDTWLDGVPLSIPPPKNTATCGTDELNNNNNINNNPSQNEERNTNNQKQIGTLLDEIEKEDEGNNNKIPEKKNLDDDDDDDDDDIIDEDPQNIFEDDSAQIFSRSRRTPQQSTQQPPQQQQEQQPLYFWPTSTSPEVNAMLMRQQQTQNARINMNNTSSEALQEKETEAMANLRLHFAECEALVPNFSEQFFSGVTDATAADAGMCALVTHAFDRGQGHVTRHRDALIHGYSIQMASQQHSSSLLPLSLQQQQQQSQSQNIINSSSNNNNNNNVITGTISGFDQQQQQQVQIPNSGRNQLSVNNNNNNAFSPLNTTTSLPPSMLTGRRSTRQNTPRTNNNTGPVQAENQNINNSDANNNNSNNNAAAANNNNVNLNSTNNNLNITTNFSPSVSRNHFQLNLNSTSAEPSVQPQQQQQAPAFSPRNPFSPNYNNLLGNQNSNNNNNQSSTIINTSRRVAGNGGSSNSNIFYNNNMLNNSSTNNNNNNNNNNELLYYSGGNNNNNNQASAWLASRDSWNISVPASICTSLNVFSNMMMTTTSKNNENGNNCNNRNQVFVDETLRQYQQYFEMNPSNNVSSNNASSYSQNNKTGTTTNNKNNNNNTSTNDLVKNKQNNNKNNASTGFVSDGINQDGVVYASELLFGAEAQRYHAQVVKSMQNGRN